MYSPEFAREVDFDAVELAGHRHYSRIDWRDPVDRALYQDVKMYLPDDVLALTDRVGMWHSLELRVPFVDHTLMEFCARLPRNLKLRGLKTKHLLSQVAQPILPRSVFTHRKQGFAAPLAVWLRADLKGYVTSRLEAHSSQTHGILKPDTIRALVMAHHARRHMKDRQIFAVLIFQRWQEMNHGTHRHPCHDNLGSA